MYLLAWIVALEISYCDDMCVKTLFSVVSSHLGSFRPDLAGYIIFETKPWQPNPKGAADGRFRNTNPYVPDVLFGVHSKPPILGMCPPETPREPLA